MTASIIDSAGAQHFVASASLREPFAQQWFADVSLVDEAPLSGAVELRIGDVSWKCTVDPSYSGTWGQRSVLRLVAGANGWGKSIARRGYHTDSGVKGKTVASDAATDCGEALGSFAGEAVLPVDYARPTGLASVTLEDVCGEAIWWVDRDGVTHVGTRAAAHYSARVLDWDSGNNVATLDPEELATIQPGVTLTDDRLDGPKTIRELEVIINGSSVRLLAWCGVVGSPMGRIPRLLAAIVERLTQGKLWGKYEYRVVSMASDGRVNLQVVRKDTGLPDLLPISQRPGVAGAHAQLTSGARVLVEFIEGDRARPIVTGFSDNTDAGFVPVLLTLGPSAGAQGVARISDTVRVVLPPAVFNGTALISGTPTPLTGVLTWLAGSTVGNIQTGSTVVRAGG